MNDLHGIVFACRSDANLGELTLERLTAQLCGLDNVRRASLFPRDLSRLEP